MDDPHNWRELLYPSEWGFRFLITAALIWLIGREWHEPVAMAIFYALTAGILGALVIQVWIIFKNFGLIQSLINLLREWSSVIDVENYLESKINFKVVESYFLKFFIVFFILGLIFWGLVGYALGSVYISLAFAFVLFNLTLRAQRQSSDEIIGLLTEIRNGPQNKSGDSSAIGADDGIPGTSEKEIQTADKRLNFPEAGV